MRKIYSEFNNVSVSSESGTSEWYNKIQEAATGTTLPELIAKYVSGEIKDFNFKQGQYLDLSELPTSAMETLNLLRGIDNLDVINDYLKTLSDGSKKIKKVLFFKIFVYFKNLLYNEFVSILNTIDNLKTETQQLFNHCVSTDNFNIFYLT